MVTAIATETYDFEALCTPLRTSLHAKAMHLTHNPQAALDLVQDTFLHALLAWSSFRVLPDEDAIDRASAWMHRILHNQFISSCRTRSRHHEAQEAWRDEIAAATAAPSTSEQCHTRLSPGMIRALASLDDTARQIVMRVDLEEDCYQDVARDLGLAVGTLKSKLHRARRQLADALEKPKTVTLPPPSLRLVAAR